MIFADRAEAGRRLAAALAHLRDGDPVVLALVRGGLPVAFEVARALAAPLDVVLVRKIGAPQQPELAVGAVADGDAPAIVTNPDVMRMAGVSRDYVDAEARRQLAEIERRRTVYVGDRPRAAVRGRTAIVVDDGIATGATTRAALQAVRRLEPARLVLAVPVAPADTLARLAEEVDEVVCLETPVPFGAVGAFYRDFRQVSDREVVDLLRRIPAAPAPAPEEEDCVGTADKVAFLSRAGSYPGESGPVTVCETHMSWVFLTGRHAYKMKRPTRQERLDFSTLERRRHFCEEEIRLNRRLAPDVYLGTVALTEAPDGTLALGGAGAVAEWLVKMRRLPADGTLEAMALAGELRREDIEALAVRMARFYARISPERLSESGYRQRFRGRLSETQRELLRPEFALPADLVRRAADRLSRFIDIEGARLDGRVREDRIVEGHGDLRPEHVYFRPDLVVTDCLEFDRDLRLADPADELAFLAMECDRLGATHVHEWLFDGYGEATTDRPPDDLVAFYKGCRALQRAKLSIWHLDEAGCRDRGRWQDRAHEYLDLAAIYAERLL